MPEGVIEEVLWLVDIKISYKDACTRDQLKKW